MPDITAEELARLDRLLDHLGYDLEPSILIGGWATNMRVGGDVSRDIDLIIADPGLRSRLRSTLTDYTENRIHSGGTKGRGTIDGIHVDAYIPHESQLGNKLMLDVARLAHHIDSERYRGWMLLTAEAHVATKIAALLDRPDSEKGSKDAREIVRMLGAGAEARGVIEVLYGCTAGDVAALPAHIQTALDLIPSRAGLNKKERREFDRTRREWLDIVRRRPTSAVTAARPPFASGTSGTGFAGDQLRAKDGRYSEYRSAPAGGGRPLTIPPEMDEGSES